MRQIIVFTLIVSAFWVAGCVPESIKFETEFGKAGSGRGEFLGATDMAMNSDGDLVICDSGNNRFQVISPTTGETKVTGGEYGTTGMKLQGISGCGINPLTGDIWICDMRGNKLVRFDKRGNPTLKVVEKMRYPIDIAVDRRGDLYVVMAKQPQIFHYDSQGQFIETIAGTGKAALLYATAIIVHEGSLYVADYGGHRVLKLSQKGEFQAEFDKKGEYEEMKGPSGVHVDESGNLFVVDLGYVPVVMLAPNGNLISKIGTFGSEKGQFLYPRGIIAKPTGEVIILDNSRNVVLIFKKMAGN